MNARPEAKNRAQAIPAAAHAGVEDKQYLPFRLEGEMFTIGTPCIKEVIEHANRCACQRP